MKSWRSVVVAGAVLLFCAAPLVASAKGFSVLYAFAGRTDGSYPEASLLEDSADNLYGTTSNGGGTGCGGNGCGTVFRIAPDGTETILYAFQGGTDGLEPISGLIADGSGNLYGTTLSGGNPDCILHGDRHLGCGTVFKLTPDGAETVLYAFAGGTDGAAPVAGLAADQAGDLFGTTAGGGSGAKKGRKKCDVAGCGTVFEIAADGTESVLHAFRGDSDGIQPRGNVVVDSAGDLYGTTWQGGGTACGGLGCGTVFKIVSGGSEKVLYRFQGGSDGMYPGSLIMGANSDLFGTTVEGGASSWGTVFKVSTRGHEKVLYTFQGHSDGGDPTSAPLIMDAAGNLYGTTEFGGGSGGCDGYSCGTVFKLARNNKETLLHAFAGGAEGSAPVGVIRDAAGDLFGTTSSGGDADCPGSNGDGCGIVFELKK